MKTIERKSLFQTLLSLFKPTTQDKDRAKQNDENLIDLMRASRLLSTTISVLTETLLDLEWIEKKDKWTIPTQAGKNLGIASRYSSKNKRKFILLPKEIVYDRRLKEAIRERLKNTKTQKTFESKKKKGEVYEVFIADFYRNKGYHIIEHGKDMGVKDMGVDLVAVRGNNEAILIQCKNWSANSKYKITHKEIKSFQTDARRFAKKWNMQKTYRYITARFVASADIFDNSAKKYIEEAIRDGDRIDCEVIPLPKKPKDQA